VWSTALLTYGGLCLVFCSVGQCVWFATCVVSCELFVSRSVIETAASFAAMVQVPQGMSCIKQQLQVA
jgi:hypothetical protein